MEPLKNISEIPEKLFQNDRDTSLTGKPLKTAVASLIVTGVIYSGYMFMMYPGQSTVTNLSAVLNIPLIGMIALTVLTSMTHLLGLYLGFQNRYEDTFSVYGYLTVLTPLGLTAYSIPVVGEIIAVLIFLTGLYTASKGVEVLQDTSFGKAAIAVITPVIVLTVLAVVLFYSLVMILALMFALMGQNVSHGAGV